MQRIITLGILYCISLFSLQSQNYTDYLGAGNDLGITVSSSSDNDTQIGSNTITGNGLDAAMMDASRFLSQATIGVDRATINELVDYPGGYSQWIDDQIIQGYIPLSTSLDQVWAEVTSAQIANGTDPNEIGIPWAVHWHYTWWQHHMTQNDLLRQKVAYALSQILVVSAQSDLRDNAYNIASYYDVLYDEAFGNFKDLLTDVALHPAMGYYLSHLNNPPTDETNNIHPDENFAREIMQLFSIGLYELNIDGSRKLDNSGNPIPTYNNQDIKELARVFTGLGPADINDYATWLNAPYFGLDFYFSDGTIPMIVYENFHEQGSKTIVGNYTIPAGQTGMEDITQAIDHIFNHDNVGPFIARRLIQRIVKSNPSPAYIARVASIFNDNGNGIRGDMAEVIKAILLDSEARECSHVVDPSGGRLREPLMRYTQLAKAFPKDSPMGRYWNSSYGFLNDTKQMVLQSPTVFNFYLPDHQPVGELASNGLFAPEFKIHNTSSSIGYLNSAHAWINWNYLMGSWEENDPSISILTDEIENKANDPEAVINEIDILLTNGQLTDETRILLRNAINSINGDDQEYDRTRMALYLAMISPDYNVIH